jgi:hypothetical protein
MHNEHIIRGLMLLWDPGDFFVDHLTSCNSVRSHAVMGKLNALWCSCVVGPS